MQAETIRRLKPAETPPISPGRLMPRDHPPTGGHAPTISRARRSLSRFAGSHGQKTNASPPRSPFAISPSKRGFPVLRQPIGASNAAGMRERSWICARVQCAIRRIDTRRHRLATRGCLWVCDFALRRKPSRGLRTSTACAARPMNKSVAASRTSLAIWTTHFGRESAGRAVTRASTWSPSTGPSARSGSDPPSAT